MVVLIPAYEPDEQLLRLVSEFLQKTDFSVVVVNDGSSEKAAAVFAALPPAVTLLEHPQNCGKGRAMKTGMAYIAEHFPKTEGVVVVDADGQHLLPDVLRVCERLKACPDALVLGSRRFTGTVPFRSKAGNTITRYVFALASGVMVHDTQTGLRAFSADRIPALLELKGERYEYEMYMLLGAAEERIPIEEVFIETVYLDEKNSSSHFHPLRDSFRIYASILKFTCSSLIAFILDYILVLLLAGLFGRLGVKKELAILYGPMIARAVSSLCNFLINRRIVFHHKDNVFKAVVKYYAVVALVLCINIPLLHFFNLTLGLPLSIAKLIVETLLFGVSLGMQRFFVFRTKEKSV